MSARLWTSMGVVALGIILTFGLAALPGLQVMPACCLRRALLSAVASARPMCAALLPLLMQVRKGVGS